MIGWMLRNLISREANASKILKTLVRPQIGYYPPTLAIVLRHGNWHLIVKLESIRKMLTK